MFYVFKTLNLERRTLNFEQLLFLYGRSMFRVLYSLLSKPRTLNFEQPFLIHSLLITAFITLPLTASAEDAPQSGRAAEEQIYIVSEYRYVPANAADDQETGHTLCGSRCNALSANLLNYAEAGGWRLTKIDSNRELPVALNNPFISGSCVCMADEYRAERYVQTGRTK